MTIKEDKLKQYEAALVREKQRLLMQLKEAEQPEDFGDDVDDSSGVEAQEAEELSNKIGEGQAFRDRLSEIDAALERMGNGTYGICTGCGAAMHESLLDAVPESALCENCKRKA